MAAWYTVIIEDCKLSAVKLPLDYKICIAVKLSVGNHHYRHQNAMRL